jgi:hypothetical protein
MIEKYIVRMGEKILGDDDLRIFFDILESSDVKKSIIFLNGDDVLYYKKREKDVSVMIKSHRRNIGALRFYEESLVKKLMRFKFDVLDEIFDLAEEIEDMNLEEFIRLVKRRDT